MTRTLRNIAIVVAVTLASAWGLFALSLAMIEPGATPSHPGPFADWWPFVRVAVPVAAILAGTTAGIVLQKREQRRRLDALDEIAVARVVVR
jgi:hypothetical protein